MGPLPEQPCCSGRAACSSPGPSGTCCGSATASPSASGALVAAPVAPHPPRRILGSAVPQSILEDPALNAAIALLPANYNFEVHKTVARLRRSGAKRVALQFPEGLLMYACVLADIMESFAGVDLAMVMGDVTFGACCVDDYSALALEADFLVHYGHSCLVPVDVTGIPCMYVFVDIAMDVDHLVESVCHSCADMGLSLRWEEGAGGEATESGTGAQAAAAVPVGQTDTLVMAGTIQFASGMQRARSALAARLASPVLVPQESPLSPGEVLGCTAPRLPSSASAIVFVADGRFHLEALMLANPGVPAWRYDPYARRLSRERYDHAGMRRSRWEACQLASRGPTWALVLSTLGRQGNPALLERLAKAVRASGRAEPARVLMSELSPAKLRSMEADIDVWVQVACPRLSIDWGDEFSKPTLNPYEAFVALDLAQADWAPKLGEGELELAADGPTYPMDYYSGAGGGWAGVYRRQEKALDSREARDAKRALALQRALAARQALLRKKDARAVVA